MAVISLPDETILVRMADGGIVEFKKNPDTQTYACLKKGYTLTVSEQGYKMTTQDFRYFDFNQEGMLLAYGNKKHQQASLQYSATGKLQSLTTLGGRIIQFQLDEYERIKTLIKPDLTTINYAYNEAELS